MTESGNVAGGKNPELGGSVGRVVGGGKSGRPNSSSSPDVSLIVIDEADNGDDVEVEVDDDDVCARFKAKVGGASRLSRSAVIDLIAVFRRCTSCFRTASLTCSGFVCVRYVQAETRCVK